MSILPDEDIRTIYLNTKKIALSLQGKTILITGGNGFLGKYFIELFKTYNKFSNKKINILRLYFHFDGLKRFSPRSRGEH